MNRKTIAKFLFCTCLLSLNLGNASAQCQLDKTCSEFEETSYSCRENKIQKDCQKFVSLFKGLLSKGNCKRSFDTEPVFDVWYCSGIKGAASLDLHYSTLSTLKSKDAQFLFASKKLRDTMDGVIGEKHKTSSVKLEKRLNKKSKK